MRIRDLEVEVVRKEIKNLHLAVYPPEGRVRVAVPMHLDDDAVRLAVISRLGWIRRQRAAFARQARQSQREMVTGESHYVEGRRYRLTVIEDDRPPSVVLTNQRLELRVRPGTGREQREAVLARWYRQRLRAQIPQMIETWEPVIGVTVGDWRIRKMKTRWGSCNATVGRIWLNLELAKKPLACLEYVVVHEMAHLLERRHNDRFVALLDQFMPGWQLVRDELNRAPLAHEDWEY
jgi:predicted metal-dependent hydrolase